jgi:hypothetical protein
MAAASWKVDQRPQTLSIAKDLSYRYETARMEIEKPNTGVNASLAKIHVDLKNWIISCAALRQRVDEAKGTSIAVFERELTDEAMKSAKRFDAIYADALELRTKLQILIQSLRFARRVDYTMTAYEGEYRALLGAVDNLEQNLAVTEAKLGDLVTDIRTTIPQLNQALLARLKVNLISQNLNNLEGAMASVESLLATDKDLDNLTKPLKTGIKRFNKYVLEARYFEVIDLGNQLSKDCSAVKLKIQNHEGHAGVKSSYLKSTSSICSTLESDLSLFIEDNPGEVIASSIHDLRLDRLKTRCQQPNPGMARCAMLSWLGKITREQIQAMEPGMLRGLEMLWAEAEGEVLP